MESKSVCNHTSDNKIALKLRLVDLNHNFECDWLIELTVRYSKLSNNKLSDNNLPSELVEIGVFFKPITIEKIVIFMIIINLRVKKKKQF